MWLRKVSAEIQLSKKVDSSSHFAAAAIKIQGKLVGTKSDFSATTTPNFAALSTFLASGLFEGHISFQRMMQFIENLSWK